VKGRVLTIGLLFVLFGRVVAAHSGPPFPIVSDQPAGPYVVSIWTDPDTTDDGTARGQFWIRLHPAASSTPLLSATQVRLAVTPADGRGPARRAAASAVRGDATNQFAAVVLDHEGRFAVRVDIDGPLGRASVEAAVDATYDLRPPRALFLLYLLPFLLAGLLWGRLIVKRRASAATAARQR
jgi:hypothetical protein